MRRTKIRVAIVGVGNCASSLVQGVHFYKDAAVGEAVPGLMHVDLGGYHVGDVEFSCAFGEAGYAAPNNTFGFAEVGTLGVNVYRGPTHDGIGKYLKDVVAESTARPVDVAKVLRDTETDVVVSYLPVGRQSPHS